MLDAGHIGPHRFGGITVTDWISVVFSNGTPVATP
jgi:hypothetical protein